MKNQVLLGTPTSPRFAACPITIKAGDPVLLGNGTIPAFAVDDYQANYGGTTFYTNGTYATTVVASTSESPIVGSAVKPGDELYATGTLDSATNVIYNLTIDKNSSNTKFGQLDPQVGVTIASAQTDTNAAVRI